MQRIAVALPFALMLGGQAQAAESPAGVWLTEEKTSKIRIAPCGKTMCATILWAQPSGRDDQNPDPSLRSRSMIGLALSKDIRSDDKGRWSASMYNPENGKTYKTTLVPRGRELEIEGCVLGGLLCGSETWQRSGEVTSSLGQ